MTKQQFRAAFSDARRDYREQANRQRYEQAICRLSYLAGWFTVDVLTYRQNVREYPFLGIGPYRFWKHG